jgi:exonuclease VII small subunit
MNPDGPSFEEAWDELVTIRAALEEGRAGIGSVRAALSRATYLVDVCRRHLRSATIAVEELGQRCPAEASRSGGWAGASARAAEDRQGEGGGDDDGR